MSRITTTIACTLMLLAALTSNAAAETPSEAYMEFHDTLKKSFTVQSIWPHYTAAARQDFETQFPPQMRGRAFHFMKSAAPNEVKVAKESVEGETARLELLPINPPDVVTGSGTGAVSGEALMRLEDGSWKVEKVTWQVP